MVIEGTVVEGRKLGRQLGFPTANVEISAGRHVERGVYISKVTVGDEEYRAVTNVGTNPTAGAVALRSESYILDFEGNLYGMRITIELEKRLRSEIHFESLEALKSQIQSDISQARQSL